MIDKDINFIHELEKLSHYLHGANNVCEDENASATFHQAKHYLDDIIKNIRIHHASITGSHNGAIG